MSAAAQLIDVPRRPERYGSRRTRVLLVILAVVVSLAVASGVVLRYLDGRYGPVEGGSFSGPLSDHGLVFSKHGFSYRLASTPGTTAKFVAMLDNNGSHSVDITSIEPPSEVSDVRWSVYRSVPGGSAAGVNTPWRSFPATVPAHGMIRLLLTVHRPACNLNGPGGGVSSAFDGSLLVNWRSLLRTHATFANVLPRPIPIC